MLPCGTQEDCLLLGLPLGWAPPPVPQLEAMDSSKDMLDNAVREGWAGRLGLAEPRHASLTQTGAESWTCLKTEPYAVLENV